MIVKYGLPYFIWTTTAFALPLFQNARAERHFRVTVISEFTDPVSTVSTERPAYYESVTGERCCWLARPLGSVCR